MRSQRALRTWPYGTEKPVRVLCRESVRNSGDTFVLLVEEIAESGSREGFVLVLKSPHDADLAKVGDVGKITFLEGGPTGGYWDYSVVDRAKP